jgi:sensor histidine kinase YesM
MANSPLSNTKFKIAFIAIFSLIACIQIWIILGLQIGLVMAVKDAILSNFLLAMFCWLIANNLSFYQPSGNKYFYVIIWCMVLAAIDTASFKYLNSIFIETDAYYLNFLNKSIQLRFLFSFLLIGCMAAVSILYYKLQDQQELLKRKNEIDKFTKEAELTLLREKLQPHFLFNSLNSISALTLNNPKQARKMVQQLSDFLRGTINNNQDFSSLKSELEHLNLYLEIEKVRFGDRLSTSIEADEITLAKKIPPMLLQPVVENAIKFGLYDTLEDVTISIIAKYQNPYLYISIINPFDMETSHHNKGTGFGLNSIKRRLHLLFNQQNLLKTEIKETQFITTILIPQAHD